MLPESHKMLFDMQQAVARIERFAAGATFESFQSNEMLRSAVERQFEIIGEALSRLRKPSRVGRKACFPLAPV
jgi:uncharacterized protein with HEPN domain